MAFYQLPMDELPDQQIKAIESLARALEYSKEPSISARAKQFSRIAGNIPNLEYIHVQIMSKVIEYVETHADINPDSDKMALGTGLTEASVIAMMENMVPLNLISTGTGNVSSVESEKLRVQFLIMQNKFYTTFLRYIRIYVPIRLQPPVIIPKIPTFKKAIDEEEFA